MSESAKETTLRPDIVVIAIGDIVGDGGLKLVERHIEVLRQTHKADLVLVNGENSAPDGRGITREVHDRLRAKGVDVITTGNHVWGKREGYGVIGASDRLLRPLNFPAACPGRGLTFIPLADGREVAVINVQGRVFMHEQLSCPFQALDSILPYVKSKTPYSILDFHAEATSEKIGMGFFVDGRVSLMFGTHTHVQTADERILPQGTGYITDLGCSAAENSMLGMKTDSVLPRLITQMPSKFVVESKGPFLMRGIVARLDGMTGKAKSIERLVVRDDSPFL